MRADGQRVGAMLHVWEVKPEFAEHPVDRACELAKRLGAKVVARQNLSA